MEEERVRKIVREGYTKIAKRESCCCSPSGSKEIGYAEEELKSIPEGADLALGCGNPVAFASLREGETVLDLGSGAGIDCFLAAKKVGEKGKIIGVDMTPEMIDKARKNARKGKYRNVEFRLGEIENLPAGDNTVDAIISNCVINLSPSKNRVFEEAYRVLKSGGRLMISDIVLLKELPKAIVKSVTAYVGCVAGAMMKDKYLSLMRKAGFKEVKIVKETLFPVESMVDEPTIKATMEDLKISPEKAKEFAGSIASVTVYGIKR